MRPAYYWLITKISAFIAHLEEVRFSLLAEAGWGSDNPSYRKEPPVGASFLNSCVEILLVNMSENKVV
jgi:hypothetical protein